MKASEGPYCRCLYFSSNALARKVEKLAQESWKPVGLSPSHAYLLMLTLKEPGIQAGKLGELLILSPSTITRLVDKLLQQGLVTRSTEGKSSHVFPTAAAKKLEPALNKCLQNFYETYSQILDKEQSNALVQNMNLIIDQL